MNKTGTLALADLLSVQNQTATEYGMEPLIQVVRTDLEVHNALVTSMVGDLAEITGDQLRAVGESDGIEMVEVDEFGRAPTQKAAGGANLGIPMRLFQAAVGWTRKWFEAKTPADLARTMLAVEKGHKLGLIRALKRAIFISANYTFRDFLVKGVMLPVKRFANADGMAIPNGPNGEVFDGATHTHYLANATLTATALTALITTIVEHGHGGNVRVIINQADEAAVRALAGFVEFTDPRITLSANVTRVEGIRLDTTTLNNRAIGIFAGAEVWVKSWGIQNYAFAYDALGPKPLAIRTRNGQQTNLQPAADIDLYPLHAQYMEDEFGVAVVTRTNGAVLYFAGGAYVSPSIV